MKLKFRKMEVANEKGDMLAFMLPRGAWPGPGVVRAGNSSGNQHTDNYSNVNHTTC